MELNYSSQQAFSRAFFKAFHCSPLKFRKLPDFNLSNLYPKFKSSSLNIKMVYKDQITFCIKGHSIEYKEKILNNGCPYAANRRFSELKKAFVTHEKIYIASTFIAQEKSENKIKIKSFIGNLSEHGANIIIPPRRYVFSTFTGTWSEYIYFSRHLYMFGDFSRVNGYDIEVFKINTKKLNEDSIFQIDVYIPA